MEGQSTKENSSTLRHLHSRERDVAYLLRDTVKIPALGHICIGRHAGRPFYATVHYPAEHAEGFVSRVEKILQELRWSDDGAGLGE